jgi:hypothetical protein
VTALTTRKALAPPSFALMASKPGKPPSSKSTLLLRDFMRADSNQENDDQAPLNSVAVLEIEVCNPFNETIGCVTFDVDTFHAGSCL